MKPLEGLKIVDLGSALAAPYAAMMLADLGAEVVKVEKPKRGDLIRFTDEYVGGESGYFLGVNRGKDGVTIDIRTEEGRKLITELASSADVLIENFRSHRMSEWGLGYEQLKAVNPRLIYCSISAFGDAAGFEEEGGNDILGQAYSGLLDITGEANGGPSKAGTPVVDISGANLAAIGILSALYRRNQTGTGEHIQLSLLEAAYALMPNYLVSVLNGDPQFQRQGSGHPQLVPYQAFKAGDGKYIVIGAFHRSSWLAFCKALGREDLTQMPQFLDNWDRVKNRQELVTLLENELQRRSSAEWLDLFKRHRVLASPVLTMKESFETFSKLIPGLIAESSHAKLGKLRMLRPPLRFTDSANDVPLSAAPVLGQHTEERLAKAGHSQEEILGWQAKGIV